MSIPGNLYKAAKVMHERRDLVNVYGTEFEVCEAKLIIGCSSELVRCKIDLAIDSEMTPAFALAVEGLIPNLSNPDICIYYGSISIEYDYEV